MGFVTAWQVAQFAGTGLWLYLPFVQFVWAGTPAPFSVWQPTQSPRDGNVHVCAPIFFALLDGKSTASVCASFQR